MSARGPVMGRHSELATYCMVCLGPCRMNEDVAAMTEPEAVSVEMALSGEPTPYIERLQAEFRRTGQEVTDPALIVGAFLEAGPMALLEVMGVHRESAIAAYDAATQETERLRAEVVELAHDNGVLFDLNTNLRRDHEAQGRRVAELSDMLSALLDECEPNAGPSIGLCDKARALLADPGAQG